MSGVGSQVLPPAVSTPTGAEVRISRTLLKSERQKALTEPCQVEGAVARTAKALLRLSVFSLMAASRRLAADSWATFLRRRRSSRSDEKLRNSMLSPETFLGRRVSGLPSSSNHSPRVACSVV